MNKWYEKDVPEDYLRLAYSITNKKTVTKQEFISLCKLAIEITESRKLTPDGQGNMFMFIASLWLRRDNIVDDGSITSDIGGQFAEWEIPGTLDLTHPTIRKNWEELKSWVAEADKKYGAEP